MKFLKITACALLIAGTGYFIVQSMKKRPTSASMQAHIESLSHPDDAKKPVPTEDKTVASAADALTWLDNQSGFKSIANGFTNSSDTEITARTLPNTKIFLSPDDSIKINADTRNAILTDAAPAAGLPSSNVFQLYTDIEKNINDFIAQLKTVLDKPENIPYKNYFKTLNIQTGFANLTDSQRQILNKLKTAEGFCKVLRLQIEATIPVMPALDNPITQAILSNTAATRLAVQNFAQQYFNYSIPS